MARPGTFPKGVSGKPAGRPRGIEARCREFTDEALQALREALKNPREGVQAAAILLDRGWGKAAQPVSGEDGNSITMLHLIAARAASDELRAEFLRGPHAALSSVIEGNARSGEPQRANSNDSDMLVDLSTPALE
jgi:hypothetical protein